MLHDFQHLTLSNNDEQSKKSKFKLKKFKYCLQDGAFKKKRGAQIMVNIYSYLSILWISLGGDPVFSTNKQIVDHYIALWLRFEKYEIFSH